MTRAGEMVCYYLALPYMQKRGLHSVQLPNALNFAFDYALLCKVCLAFML